MASGPLVGGASGDGSRDKSRWAESKVYTRKSFHKNRNAALQSQPSPQTLARTEDASSSQQQQQQPPQVAPPQQPQRQLISRFDAAAPSEDSSSLSRRPASVSCDHPPSSTGVFPRLENRIKINLSSRSKEELQELRQRLSHELGQVSSLLKRLEDHEIQLSGHSNWQHPVNEANGDNGTGTALRENLEIASAREPITPTGTALRKNLEIASAREPITPTGTALRENLEIASATEPIPPTQFSVSIPDSSRGVGKTEPAEKEKRTPKANQFYRNSDFLLGKERIPLLDSNKKMKTNGSKKYTSANGNYNGMGIMDGHSSRVFRECGNLLSKLMKHKHGWVFNTPVDVQGLGLHDYYNIIRHPMDLGTVKSRLSKNRYTSPREFAEDVRLTFHNAMTYNPRGQDVHIMAEELLKIFEERWALIEVEYNIGNRYSVEHELSPYTPHATKKPPPIEMARTMDQPELINHSVDSKTKALSCTPTGRMAAPKKPKAKDPNKRGMTFEEKQRLSTNLVNLPPEKLDNIVQIIKKRNPSLSQNDDEIEVDIESFDVETLWELDRFVVNYRKNLSKNKKKAELANQARTESATNNVQDVNLAPATVTVEAVKETKTAEKNDASSPVQREKPAGDSSRSSSSSSSSSDSGSSSSDSDSDSSSGSDTPQSPRN